MGRRPCCSKEGLNKGAWTALEDKMLTTYVNANGEGRWRNLPKNAGLERCGKSCRLRWLNYLRPDIKRGNISSDEEELIVRLHKLLGNRWSLIAGRLPGRTDNEIKNYWNTNFGKKNVPQSSSQQSKKGPSAGKIRPRNQFNGPKNILPTTRAITNQPQPIRTKAFRCTKVVIQTPPPNYSHLNSKSNSNINSTALNSLESQAYQSPQDSYNSKMDIGIEGNDGTCGVYDPNFFDFSCHDLQTSRNNDPDMCYNLNTNSCNDSCQHLQFDDLVLDDWITSNELEENGDMDLGSLAFLLDCDKW